MTENEVLTRIKNRFTKELKSIIGEGNLLEALNIFSGAFQNAVSCNRSKEYIDSRNHDYLLKLNKENKEELSNYFNKRLSLQGLFLIYEKAYQLLKENSKRNAQEVISGIYDIVKQSELGKNLNGVIDDNNKLSLLNILANPQGTPVFATEKDFEEKVLVNIRNLLNSNITLNDSNKELALTQCVVNLYYSIHKDIRVKKDLALLLCMWYEKNLPLKKENKDKILKVRDNKLMLYYIMDLSQTFHNMTCSSTMMNPIAYGTPGIRTQDKKYAFDYLSKNQSSNEFEKTVTNSKNTVYQCDEGDTILHLAALSGYTDIVNDLIENGENINAVNKYGYTPLHYAAESGNKDVVALLLEKGADLLLKNKGGKTPIDLAKNDDTKKLLEEVEKKRQRKTSVCKRHCCWPFNRSIRYCYSSSTFCNRNGCSWIDIHNRSSSYSCSGGTSSWWYYIWLIKT